MQGQRRVDKDYERGRRLLAKARLGTGSREEVNEYSRIVDRATALMRKALKDEREGKKHGHSPGHLRDALIEALDHSPRSREPWWDRLKMDFFDAAQQRRWNALKPKERARWLTGKLWNCTDCVPSGTCEGWDLPAGSSYAQLVRHLRADLS